MKKILALLSLGAILEYYDYAIFIYFAKNIGESLIPIQDTTANIIASFSILAIGAGLRPLGGIIFSHFGDTRGRKNIFIYTILLMAIPTFLIGLIPGYSKIGISATIILILLRSIQGLAIGGEIPGSIVFAYESSQSQNKALNVNIVIAGTNIGFFLASMFGAALLNYTNLGIAPWRIAFMLGGSFGILSYYLRKNLTETPEFIKYKAFIENQPHPPLKKLFRAYKVRVLEILAFASLIASSLAVFTFFMPTYLTVYYHFPLYEILRYNSYSIIIFIISALITGKFHYLFGRKFFVSSIILFVAASFYLFTHYKYLSLIQIVYWHFFILFYLGLIAGRLPVIAANFFPTQVRYSGIALSYNIAFGIIAGFSQMILFALIKVSGYMWIPAAYITFFACLALIFFARVPAKKLTEYI